MRRISFTLSVGMALVLGAGNSLRAEDMVVIHVSDHCNPPTCLPAPCVPETCKTCVSVPKHNTKVVHSSVCKDYCLPHCGLSCLSHGCNDCQDGCGPCGRVRTRHVLTKKFVPDCDTTQCVVQESPAPVCCGSAPVYMPAPSKAESIPVKPVPAK
jgi:hypothetical protein